MEVFLFDKNFPDIKAEKARILPSNHISLVNNLTIMGSLRYDSQAQAQQRIKGMQANHREAQESEDTLSLILMIKQRFQINSQVGESEGQSAQTIAMKNKWWQHQLAKPCQHRFVLAFCMLVRSVLCTCCGRSRVYVHESSERSPLHLFLYLVLIQK